MPSISATSDTVMLYGGSNRLKTASLRSSENLGTAFLNPPDLVKVGGVNYPARAGSPEEAISLLSESILSVGFIDFRTLAGRALNEFITSEETRSRRTFCRDDFAYLSLEATTGVGLNDVLVSNIGGQSLPDFSSCQEEADRQRAPGFSLHGAELKEMMQFAPVLNLPQNAIMIRPPVVGNTSGSPDVYETSAEFLSEMKGIQIIQLLARQIELQPWYLGVETKENVSLSGTWFRQVTDKYSLRADVNLLELAAGRFSIQMRIEKFPLAP